MSAVLRPNNIDAAGADTRLRVGVVSLGASLLVLLGLAKVDGHWLLGALSLPPLYVAFLLTYQAAFRVCPNKAKHCVRDLGFGDEKVTSPLELAMHQRRARNIQLLSLGSAAVVGFGFLALAQP